MKKFIFHLPAFMILAFLTWQVTPAQTAPLSQSTVIASEVETALQENERVRVILNLNTPELTVMSMDDRTATVQSIQDSVLGELSAADFTLKRRFQIIPAMAVEINAAALKTLSQNSNVASIQIDQPIEIHDTVSLNALQANTVHSGYGVTGQGVTAAVLDTGIDVDNSDFSGRIVAQHCFTDGNCQPGNTDESSNGDDLNGHGTNVAGIIASNGSGHTETKGFAPAAKLVSVRVMSADGSGYVSDWEAGLEWVYQNLSTTPVDIINMSIGTNDQYYDNCDSFFSDSKEIITLLHNAGVAIFASSGNAGNFYEISSPACLNNVIAVGATYDSNIGPSYWSSFGCYDASTSLNTITCFTNRSAMLDILAPGAIINSSKLGGSTPIEPYSMFAGTSQAAPTAAGVAALMLQVNPDLTPDQIQTTMQDTGVAIYDSHSTRTYYRIDALKAVQSLTSAIIAGNTVGLVGDTYTFTAVINPFSASLPATYTWTSSGFSPIVITNPSVRTASYTFTTAGTKTINLTVTNDSGSFTDTHTIKVFTSLPNKSYLPVALK